MRKVLAEDGRPDKSVPCPRCHSLNTKFCYFNNYNVKQPRHFCRECQRYWTAGGSLRNVPIGAGRRKHKIGSAISSKVHGSTAAITLQSDIGGECAYIASIKPYASMPLKQFATCIPNGSILQEVNSFMGMQSNDAKSGCGTKKPSLSQLLQKPAVNVAVDTNMSMVSHGHGSNLMVLTSAPGGTGSPLRLGCAEMLQKHSKSIAIETKGANGHRPATSMTSCKDDGKEQDKVFKSERGDAYGINNESEAFLSHTSNATELHPSDSKMTCALPETTQGTEHGQPTCCTPSTVASSASVSATSSNASHTATDTLPSASKPVGLENTPSFWGPFMWPWIWPFFVNGPNAAQVDPSFAAGIGALAASGVPHADQLASSASHIDTTRTSAFSPIFPHWPYVWNPSPWGSPWNMACNLTNVGHSHLLQEPLKEKQGLLCVPKTLRMDRPDEAAHSSILRTLGVTALAQSPSGFHNSFQPKADVFQPKTMTRKGIEHSELHHHRLPHLNPAAQARSVAFQEGS